MFYKKYISFFLTLIISCPNMFALRNMNNGGSITSKVINMEVAETLNNTGSMLATEQIFLACETLSGNGIIKSPVIKIVAKKFSFTGTIDCDQECSILTEEPVHQEDFKRTGGGKFIFETIVPIKKEAVQVEVNPAQVSREEASIGSAPVQELPNDLQLIAVILDEILRDDYYRAVFDKFHAEFDVNIWNNPKYAETVSAYKAALRSRLSDYLCRIYSHEELLQMSRNNNSPLYFRMINPEFKAIVSDETIVFSIKLRNELVANKEKKRPAANALGIGTYIAAAILIVGTIVWGPGKYDVLRI